MDIPQGIRVEESDGGMLDELDMPHAMRPAIPVGRSHGEGRRIGREGGARLPRLASRPAPVNEH